jgi:hypothetical protein
MYTENLVNLFGGNGENYKPKKSNNTVIIVVIVIVIILVVLGGGYFMMNKKKNEVTTSKSSNNGECSKYSDDASGVPVECYEKLWKENGCTEDFNKLKEQSKELPPLGELKKVFELMKTNSGIKEMCFGPKKVDPSSKCAQYNNDSTNISDDCLNELYLKNCPGFDLNSQKKSNPDDLKNKKLIEHKVMADSLSTMPKEMYNLLCEKLDASSKCAQYNNESTNISDECITEMYSKECPGFDLNSLKDLMGDQVKTTNYEFFKMGPLAVKTSPLDISKQICFGSDKSKWPEPCSYFKDESNWITDDCVKDIWNKSGCTKQQPSYEYSKTLQEIKTDINNISKSTDPAIKSKCL